VCLLGTLSASSAVNEVRIRISATGRVTVLALGAVGQRVKSSLGFNMRRIREHLQKT